MRKYCVLLLAALCLTACGGERPVPPEPALQETAVSEMAPDTASIQQTRELVPEPETESAGSGSETVSDAALSMQTEWPTYDTSVRTLYFTIHNDSDVERMTGEEYTVAYCDGGIWTELPPKNDALCWNAIGIILQPGGTRALRCDLSLFDFDFSKGGRFRIEKEIDGKTCYAEFELSPEGDISADRPYGFVPLSELPKDHSKEDAVQDGCVVIPNGSDIQNAEQISVFLEKVSLNIPCQLRLQRYTVEGAPILTDVLYAPLYGAGRFALQYDNSRDGFSSVEDRKISAVQYYSFLTPDADGNLFLSTHLDAPVSGEPILLFSAEAAPYREQIQAMTEYHRNSNVTRVRVWNASGDHWCILTDDPMEFGWGNHERSELTTLDNENDRADAIANISFLTDTVLSLELRGTSDALVYDTVRFDTENGQWVS